MSATDNEPSKPGASDKKGSGSKSSAQTSKPVSDLDLLTVTIHAKTGQIVKIEGVDSAGRHHELSDEEKTNLAREKSKATLEDIIEQAFEAGIACVLGGMRTAKTIHRSLQRTRIYDVSCCGH